MEFIFFSGENCSACKSAFPVISDICIDNDIDLSIIKVEDDPNLAQQYGIRSIPVLVKIENGAPQDFLQGMNSEMTFKKFLEV